MKRSHNVNRDVLLQDIVSSLTENLVHFYPTNNNDEPPPSLVLQNWSRAVAAQYAASAAEVQHDGLVIVDSTIDNNDDLVQEAMTLAMEKWKKQCALNPTQVVELMKDATPTSFSLLDQFTSGGGLLGGAAAFFAWDNVRELQPSEQIKALQRVQYLEDVIPDWQEGVQVHLQQGLLFCCVDVAVADEHKSLLLLSEEYLELHRKWFGWSRKSNEPETAQLSIDLMVHVFQAMTSPSPSSQAATAAATSENETKMKSIMKLWWEMWMDIMIRGGGGGGGGGRRLLSPSTGGVGGDGDSRLTFIVQTIWNNWIPSPPNTAEENMQSSSSSTSSLSLSSERTYGGLLFRLLMEIDPCAKWAYAWVRIHPSWTASSIVLQAMNVSVLVPWVCHYYRDSETTTTTTTTTLGQQQEQQQNYSCFIIFVVSLLRSILVSCRVAQFPWHLFESSSLGLVQRSDVMLALQNIFLQGLQVQSQGGQPESSSDNIRICIEGMEVLLSGCCHGDKALYTKLVGNVESFVADNNKGGRRDEARMALQEIMKRHLF